MLTLEQLKIANLMKAEVTAKGVRLQVDQGDEILLTEDIFDAIIIAFAAAANGKKEYEVVKRLGWPTGSEVAVLGTVWGTSITDAYDQLKRQGYSVGPDISVRSLS